VLVETLSNPLLRAAPIDRLAAETRKLGAVLIADATFTPPPMLQPLALGADLVVHSLTKFLSGHGDVTLGAVAGGRETIGRLRPLASLWGWHASAFDCWATERGLETLSIRWERAVANAARLGVFLRGRPAVLRVHDANDHANHPDGAWLRMHARTGNNMLAFDLAGGRDAVNRLFQRFKRIGFCPSLGDVRTTVSYPWRTSHLALADEEKHTLGVTPGTVRVSVGIEPFEEIVDDFRHALPAPP
jgi:cystathionine beta-lyase/cystathionine gamma-synthase